MNVSCKRLQCLFVFVIFDCVFFVTGSIANFRIVNHGNGQCCAPCPSIKLMLDAYKYNPMVMYNLQGLIHPYLPVIEPEALQLDTGFNPQYPLGTDYQHDYQYDFPMYDNNNPALKFNPALDYGPADIPQDYLYQAYNDYINPAFEIPRLMSVDEQRNENLFDYLDNNFEMSDANALENDPALSESLPEPNNDQEASKIPERPVVRVPVEPSTSDTGSEPEVAETETQPEDTNSPTSDETLEEKEDNIPQDTDEEGQFNKSEAQDEYDPLQAQAFNLANPAKPQDDTVDQSALESDEAESEETENPNETEQAMDNSDENNEAIAENDPFQGVPVATSAKEKPVLTANPVESGFAEDLDKSAAAENMATGTQPLSNSYASPDKVQPIENMPTENQKYPAIPLSKRTDMSTLPKETVKVLYFIQRIAPSVYSTLDLPNLESVPAANYMKEVFSPPKDKSPSSVTMSRKPSPSQKPTPLDTMMKEFLTGTRDSGVTKNSDLDSLSLKTIKVLKFLQSETPSMYSTSNLPTIPGDLLKSLPEWSPFDKKDSKSTNANSEEISNRLDQPHSMSNEDELLNDLEQADPYSLDASPESKELDEAIKYLGVLDLTKKTSVQTLSGSTLKLLKFLQTTLPKMYSSTDLPIIPKPMLFHIPDWYPGLEPLTVSLQTMSASKPVNAVKNGPQQPASTKMNNKLSRALGNAAFAGMNTNFNEFQSDMKKVSGELEPLFNQYSVTNNMQHTNLPQTSAYPMSNTNKNIFTPKNFESYSNNLAETFENQQDVAKQELEPEDHQLINQFVQQSAGSAAKVPKAKNQAVTMAKVNQAQKSKAGKPQPSLASFRSAKNAMSKDTDDSLDSRIDRIIDETLKHSPLFNIGEKASSHKDHKKTEKDTKNPLDLQIEKMVDDILKDNTLSQNILQPSSKKTSSSKNSNLNNIMEPLAFNIKPGKSYHRIQEKVNEKKSGSSYATQSSKKWHKKKKGKKT